MASSSSSETQSARNVLKWVVLTWLASAVIIVPLLNVVAYMRYIDYAELDQTTKDAVARFRIWEITAYDQVSCVVGLAYLVLLVFLRRKKASPVASLDRPAAIDENGGKAN